MAENEGLNSTLKSNLPSLTPVRSSKQDSSFNTVTSKAKLLAVEDKKASFFHSRNNSNASRNSSACNMQIQDYESPERLDY
mmetsp:Transcript_11468/g.8397  ORF Transcript_11468/g.8397 Transcript_11468/m.8397 type:complete len:81 (-) Transcript_11468:31-273(-)